jgi:hypothetical protein
MPDGADFFTAERRRPSIFPDLDCSQTGVSERRYLDFTLAK